MLPFYPIQKFLGNARAHDRVQRSKRLVHQQQLRFYGEDLGDGDALSLAAGKLVGKTPAETLQPEPREPSVGLG